MPPRRRKRLDPAVFNLPVDQIKAGFYSDVYLEKSRALVRQDKRPSTVLIQVTARETGYLGGIDETVAILKLCSDDWAALTVNALYEGDWFDDWETVLTIEGPYESFAYLEPIWLGLLARRTGICTTVRRTVEVARPKRVFFFGGRDDAFTTQPGDGFSAWVAGAALVGTPALASLFGGKTVGTVPHSLIATCGGNTVRAATKFAEAYPEETEIIVRVDYQNDSVKTSLELARALEGRLWGVRLETPDSLVDKSVLPLMGTFAPTGVNPQLVWNVRNALDGEGFGDVKILVAGGFDEERIQVFEEEGVPVDAYGVSASMLEGRIDFIADVVQVDGKPQSRSGRELRPNEKLERVK
jgi:nicotinate phosphoribosyltransferase